MSGTNQRFLTSPACVMIGIGTIVLVVMPLIYHFFPEDTNSNTTLPAVIQVADQAEHDRMSTLLDEHNKKISKLESQINEQKKQLMQLADLNQKYIKKLENDDINKNIETSQNGLITKISNNKQQKSNNNTPNDTKKPHSIVRPPRPLTDANKGRSTETTTTQSPNNNLNSNNPNNPNTQDILPVPSVPNIADISPSAFDQKGLELQDDQGNKVIFADTGVIYGNPLHLDVCKNALLPDHEVNVLRDLASEQGIIPRIWSRESIGAALQHIKFNQETIGLTSNFDSDTSILYIDTQQTDFDIVSNEHAYTIQSNQNIKSKCTFTLINDPIDRFVKAYYKINALIFISMNGGHSDTKDDFGFLTNGTFTFWKIEGEPNRFRAFVDDITRYHYKFLTSNSAMQNIMTQVGLLGLADVNNIQVIGRLDKIEEHWGVLSKLCEIENDKKTKDIMDDVFSKIHKNKRSNNFGVGKHDGLNEKYYDMMSLPINGDIPDPLPAYKVMDYNTWHKIVEYMWQDFVCFDYNADYANILKIAGED